MTTRRAFLHLLLALALAGVVLFSASCAPPQEEPTPTPVPRPAVPNRPTYEVQRGDVLVQLQFPGRIIPMLEQALYFRTDGNVRRLYVAEGDAVTANQVLADLEVIDELERQKALDDLSVRRAEVNVEIARLRLALAEAQPDSATKRIEVAIRQNEVTLAEIALEETRLGLSDVDALVATAQVVAPFDGQVISVDIAEGDAVNAFSPVMVVADLNTLEVSADLRQSQLESLLEGMPVTIAPISRPGQMLGGVIRRVPYRVTTGEDASVRITLDTPPAEAGLELRERVQVTAVVEQKQGVLWLPPQAIRTFEGRQFVVVEDGDVQQRVDVTLGLRSGDRVEIVEGLSEGQIVVGP